MGDRVTAPPEGSVEVSEPASYGVGGMERLRPLELSKATALT
jgi:hypothetical protein